MARERKARGFGSYSAWEEVKVLVFTMHFAAAHLTFGRPISKTLFTFDIAFVTSNLKMGIMLISN